MQSLGDNGSVAAAIVGLAPDVATGWRSAGILNKAAPALHVQAIPGWALAFVALALLAAERRGSGLPRPGAAKARRLATAEGFEGRRAYAQLSPWGGVRYEGQGMRVLDLLENGLFALGQVLRFPVMALLWVCVFLTLPFMSPAP